LYRSTMKRPLFAIIVILSVLSQRTVVLSRSLNPTWETSVVQRYSTTKLTSPSFLAADTQSLQVPQTIVNGAKEGVNILGSLCQTLVDNKESIAKIAKYAKLLGKMAAALGGIGFVFSIASAFMPGEEGNQMAEVMNKMDAMEYRLTNLIESQFSTGQITNLKATLSAVEMQITEASRRLNNAEANKVQNKRELAQFFSDSFVALMKDGQGEKSLATLFNTFKYTLSLGNPFPTQISSYTNGDSAQVTQLVKGLMILLTKASVNYMAYLNIVNPKVVEAASADYSNQLVQVSAYLETLPTVTRNDMVNYLSAETFTKMMAGQCEGQAACNQVILRELTKKYPNLYFTTFLVEKGKDWAMKQEGNFALTSVYGDWIGAYWASKSSSCSISPIANWEWENMYNGLLPLRYWDYQATANRWPGQNQVFIAYWEARGRWRTPHSILTNYPTGSGPFFPRINVWGVRLQGEC